MCIAGSCGVYIELILFKHQCFHISRTPMSSISKREREKVVQRREVVCYDENRASAEREAEPKSTFCITTLSHSHAYTHHENWEKNCTDDGENDNATVAALCRGGWHIEFPRYRRHAYCRWPTYPEKPGVSFSRSKQSDRRWFEEDEQGSRYGPSYALIMLYNSPEADSLQASK